MRKRERLSNHTWSTNKAHHLHHHRGQLNSSDRETLMRERDEHLYTASSSRKCLTFLRLIYVICLLWMVAVFMASPFVSLALRNTVQHHYSSFFWNSQRFSCMKKLMWIWMWERERARAWDQLHSEFNRFVLLVIAQRLYDVKYNKQIKCRHTHKFVSYFSSLLVFCFISRHISFILFQEQNNHKVLLRSTQKTCAIWNLLVQL